MTPSLTPRPTWVPPQLLSAQVAVVTSDDTATSHYLRPGPKIRIIPSGALGYPICPFTIWRAGVALSSSLGSFDGHRVRLMSGQGGDACAVAGFLDGSGKIALLDSAGRILRGRSRRDLMVAQTPLPGVQWDGNGYARIANYQQGLQTGADGSPSVPKWIDAPPIDAIGGPFPTRAWWSGVPAAIDGTHPTPGADLKGRVLAMASDNPLPFGSDQPGDALGRAQAAAPTLADEVQRAWREPANGTPPALHAMTPTLSGGATARVTMPLTSALFGASADPAGAGWWGFAGGLADDPICNEEEVSAYAVAALWVLPDPKPGLTGDTKVLIDTAARVQQDPMAKAFRDKLMQVHPDLPDIAKALEHAGRNLACLWTITVAAPPPDPPRKPAVTVDANERGWSPDGTWTAVLQLTDDPRGVVALQRDGQPRNELLINGGAQRWRRPILPARSTAKPNVGIVVDGGCAARAARYQILVADMWGQWSDPATVTGGPPQLPPLPVPNPVLELIPSAASPAGTQHASPAAVKITAYVAEPSAGAPPISRVSAALSEAFPAAMDLAPGGPAGTWAGTAQVGPTAPGGQKTVTCTITVADTGGRTAQRSAEVTAYDPRPVIVPAHSPVLLFTGERRPDGFAELDLRLHQPAVPPGTTWRLYTTDEYAAGPVTAQPRWRRARRLQAAVTTRANMALLPGNTVTAEPDGSLRIRHRLSGRLHTVQLYQLVAVTAGGAEEPSSSCGTFAAAVPYDDTPPVPVLTAATDATTPRTVTLIAEVTYPGTRDAASTPPEPITRRGAPAAATPIARLRRTAAGASPQAAPALTPTAMVASHPADRASGWRWTATWHDVLPPKAPGWAPLTYWAEAAWPDEPAWDPAAAPEFGEVRPTWSGPRPQPSAWTAPSNAVHVVAPEPTPTVTPAWSIGPGATTAAITVTVPAAHPSAPPWSLTAIAPGQHEQHASGHGPTLTLDHVPVDPAASPWLLSLVAPDGSVLPIVYLYLPPEVSDLKPIGKDPCQTWRTRIDQTKAYIDKLLDALDYAKSTTGGLPNDGSTPAFNIPFHIPKWQNVGWLRDQLTVAESEKAEDEAELNNCLSNYADSPLLISWLSGDPVQQTPRGPYQVTVTATDTHGSVTTTITDHLDAITSVSTAAQIPAFNPNDLRIYRVLTPARRYYAWLPRPAPAAYFKVTVTATNPLGRVSELSVSVPDTPIVPNLP